MNRQEPEEVILAFARKIATAFPNQYFYVLNLRDDKTLPRGQKIRKTLEENNGYSVCEITLNDSHEDGDSPQVNPKKFWLGDVDAWQKIISDEFSLSDKSMNPIKHPIKVSVIIPCYNVEKYLRKCLDSVVNQTLREIEIICVDDGSADSTPQILEEYAAKDSRVKILYQKNQFAGVARNKGMKIASGKYLCFLDSDDFFEPTMLEKMFLRAEEADAEIVICDFWEFVGDNSPENKKREVGLSRKFFAKRKLRNKRVFSSGDALATVSVERFALAPWNKLFRREFVETIGNKFSSTRIANDLAFVAFALFCANRITILSSPFVYYRQIVKNSISATRGRHQRDNLVAWKDLRGRLLACDVYGRTRKSFLTALANSLIYELSQNPSKDFLNEVYCEFPELSASQRRRIERKAFAGK